jgi:peptide deformylase
MEPLMSLNCRSTTDRKINSAAWILGSTLAFGLVACAPTTKAGCERPGLLAGALSSSELAMIRGAGPSVRLPMVENATAKGNGSLRTPSLPLSPGAVGVDHLVARMRASLHHEKGVGLAAPQIGINRRVVLVQRFDAVGNRRAKCDERRCPVKVYFNLRILAHADARELGWEGCLSVPAGFGKIERSRELTIAYQDAAGRARTERVFGFTARIFQHELDHINGALFIDRKLPGKLMPKQEYRQMRAREAAKRATTPSNPSTPSGARKAASTPPG